MNWKEAGDRLIHGENVSREELAQIALVLLDESVKTHSALDAFNAQKAKERDARYALIRDMRRRGEKNAVICAELGVSESTIKRAMRNA